MRSPRNGSARQRGVTLIIGLVVLVVLMALGLGVVSLSRSDLLGVFNRQARQDADAVAQLAIEQVMGDVSYFSNPTSAVVPNHTRDMTVTVANRTCLARTPATGYSAKSTMTPEDTVWDVAVTVTDPATGASTTMHQGVKVQMLGAVGSCP